MTAPWPSLIRLNPSAQMRMLDGFNGQDRVLGLALRPATDRSVSATIGSTADPDLLDDPVMMAPVLDQLDMAAVVAVVAAPLTVIALIVAIFIVVVDSLAFVITANLYLIIVG